MAETIEQRSLPTDVPPILHADLLADLPEPIRARLAPLLLARRGSGEITLSVAVNELRPLYAALTERFETHLIDFFAEIPLSGPSSHPNPERRLHLLCGLDELALTLHLVATLPDTAPSFASLVDLVPAADWYEREIWDEHGLRPEGHPMLTRWQAPAEPGKSNETDASSDDSCDARGTVPRALEVTGGGAPETADARIPLLGVDEEHEMLDPGPEGIVDYPLGPVHSGVLESAHYTLRTVGEEIVDCRLQLRYKRRGVEALACGRSPLHLPLLAERISGTSGFAHALAACEALERAIQRDVPLRARYLRTFFAELERLYNHLGYQADLCQATGLVVGQAQFDILKEQVLRLNAHLTGHRYLFGACIVGGVAYDVSPEQLHAADTLLAAMRRKTTRLARMVMQSPSHVDRLAHTGILLSQEATALAVTGPIGRASGIDRDLRRDAPYAAYGEVIFDVPVLTEGDALARACIRLEELTQTFRILEQICDKLPAGAIYTSQAPDLEPAEADTTALGWVESPRGAGYSWVRLDQQGSVATYRTRMASFANAQAFPLCVPGHNILTDFPVIEQSWGISIAGADR